MAGKDGIEFARPEVVGQHAAQDVAEIRRQREIPPLVELLGLEPRPLAVEPPSTHGPTDDEHRGGVTDLLIGRVFHESAGDLFKDMDATIERAKMEASTSN